MQTDQHTVRRVGLQHSPTLFLGARQRDLPESMHGSVRRSVTPGKCPPGFHKIVRAHLRQSFGGSVVGYRVKCDALTLCSPYNSCNVVPHTWNWRCESLLACTRPPLRISLSHFCFFFSLTFPSTLRIVMQTVTRRPGRQQDAAAPHRWLPSRRSLSWRSVKRLLHLPRRSQTGEPWPTCRREPCVPAPSE